MPVRMSCPRCNGPCLVADQHLGATVQCSHCRQPFVARPAPAEAPPRPPRLEVGSATSVGRVRRRNEDSFLVQQVAWSDVDGFQEVVLLALADGMGGYEAGHQASRLVIETVGATLAPLLAGRLDGPVQNRRRRPSWRRTSTTPCWRPTAPSFARARPTRPARGWGRRPRSC